MRILPANEAIYIGRDWSLPLYYTQPKIDILSSASGIITAVGEHGYTDGDRIYVGNHNNSSGIYSTLNGISTVSDKTTSTFKNGRISNGTGSRTGFAAKVINLTGGTVTAQIRETDGEGAILLAAPSQSLTLLDGRILLSMSNTVTDDEPFASRVGGSCVLEVVFTDTAENKHTVVLLELKIKDRVVQ